MTGAGQGIGRAIACRLARDGFALAIVDVNTNALDEVKKEIESLGAQVLALKADLTKVDEIQKAIDLSAEWGQLTVLVNNAGRVLITPFLEITEGEWDAILTLNLKTVFFAMQFAARHMQTGGRMVNLSSISGRSGPPRSAALCSCQMRSDQSYAIGGAGFCITGHYGECGLSREWWRRP